MIYNMTYIIAIYMVKEKRFFEYGNMFIKVFDIYAPKIKDLYC